MAASFSLAFAENNDGFNGTSKMEGEHLTIEYFNDVDPSFLNEIFRISPMDEQLTNLKIDKTSIQKEILSKLEIVFNRASDLMDMHIYSFKGSIKVFANHQQLQDFFNTLFKNSSLPCTGYAFYSEKYNSIYISADHFKREILGHELGHAIMSRYFVVQPSVKIQEVLAGYIEYQLKKSTE